MIAIRTAEEMKAVRSACRLTAEAMAVARDALKPGVTTQSIADKVQHFIESNGGRAAFLGYGGFPGAICISLNDEVVHGIPGERVIHEGDLVKFDLGAYRDGFYGDMTRTFPAGKATEAALKLARVTRESLQLGLAQAVPGKTTGDMGNAIQTHVESHGFSVVRALVGHGIGRNLHEDPQVPNFGKPGRGVKLRAGMVLAVEPMVNAGAYEVETLDDDWTVVTADGSLSAHVENTCMIRDGFPEVLTVLEGEEPWEKMTQ